MTTTSVRRLTENEAMFRKSNESVIKDLRHVQEKAKGEGWSEAAIDPDVTKLHFFCECSNEDCRERITLDIPTYHDIHTNRRCFTVIPGHEVKKVEDVIDREDDFYVVKKITVTPENPTQLHATDL